MAEYIPNTSYGRNGKKSHFKCPYCKTKNHIHAQNCLNCKMDFKQLDNISNKEAKIALKNKVFGESLEGEVIYTKHFPFDLKKWQVVMLWLIIGMFGGHNIFVGKKTKGIIAAILMIIGIICVILYNYIGYNQDSGITGINFALIGALFMMFPVITWAVDGGSLLFNSYEVPVKLKKSVYIPYVYETNNTNTMSSQNTVNNEIKIKKNDIKEEIRKELNKKKNSSKNFKLQPEKDLEPILKRSSKKKNDN